MQVQNQIITTITGQTVFVGNDALKYADLKSNHPVCYPDGYIEKGDILIYLSFNQECVENVSGKTGVRYGSQTDEPKKMLIIAALLNDDVSPIIETDFDSKKQNWELIETIYERTEITVKGHANIAELIVGRQSLKGDLLKSKELACIVRNDEIIYFTPDTSENFNPVADILEAGRFPAYIDEERINGKHISEIIKSDIWKKISEMNPSQNMISVNEFGKNILVERVAFMVEKELYYAYYFYDKETAEKELIKKTEYYNSLLKQEKEKPISEIHYNSFRLWGSNGKLMELERLLQKASVTNSTVLLAGESGTGKTFLAREIHNCSKRAAKPFVHVNCAAIPYHLMESEMFGYEEGAFTGAKKGGKAGLFEMAYGGTLFLDEITEIPLSLQGKLLEVLQSKTFFRVGGTQKLSVDVRLIAATNRNLKELVIEKNFREDLYYRINVFPIEIPPLRDRMESIQAIIGDILPDICDRLEIEPVIVGYQALEKMKNYYWPGNIRELENVLEKAAILCDGKLIMPDDIVLPEHDDFILKPKTLKELKESCEKEAIKNALNMFHWDKIRAAQYLDIGRTNMFDKIRKYRLDEEKVGEYDFR